MLTVYNWMPASSAERIPNRHCILPMGEEGLQADTLLCVLSSTGQGSSELVIHRDVPEKVRHGLAIVDSSNCLRKNQADVHSLYLGTL